MPNHPREIDKGGDREYATMWKLHTSPHWEKGPIYLCNKAMEAERYCKEWVTYTQGVHHNNFDVRSRRLDAKSVWKGGNDKELSR